MAIASLISGGLGYMGAQQNAAAAERAAAEARQAGEIARADLSGWQQAGLGATNQIAQLLGLGRITTRQNDGWSTLDPSNAAEDQRNAFAKFQTDPGYEFRVREGVKARDRGAAAKGMVLSGAQNKSLDAFGQDLASEEFTNYFNRLAAVAGSGSQAASSSSNTNAAAARAAGEFTTQAGQARQSGYNALASGVIRADNNAQKWASRLFGGGMMGG